MMDKDIAVNPNKRGADFEALIGILLEFLRARHPKLVRVIRHPKIALNNGTHDTADFELICELPHQIDHRIIECQDRKRSSQDIVRKIRDMKAQSSKNRFILVFREEDFLSEAVTKALKSDGIVYYSLVGFAAFLNQLSGTLDAVAGLTEAGDFVAIARVLDGIELLDRFSSVLGPELGVKSRTEFELAIKAQSKQKDEAMLASSEPRRFRW